MSEDFRFLWRVAVECRVSHATILGNARALVEAGVLEECCSGEEAYCES